MTTEEIETKIELEVISAGLDINNHKHMILLDIYKKGYYSGKVYPDINNNINNYLSIHKEEDFPLGEPKDEFIEFLMLQDKYIMTSISKETILNFLRGINYYPGMLFDFDELTKYLIKIKNDNINIIINTL